MLRVLAIWGLLIGAASGQTVVSVVDGRTIALDTGQIIRIRDADLTTNATARQLRLSKGALQLWVLDRVVTLVNPIEVGWGMVEADVLWRGIDVGQELTKTHHLVKASRPVTVGATRTIATPKQIVVQRPSPIVRPGVYRSLSPAIYSSGGT